jgi:hypothetical protein
MKVIDLINKLEKLNPDKEVMVDQTTENSMLFKFTEITFVDEVDTALGESIVLISPIEYEETDELLTPQNP